MELERGDGVVDSRELVVQSVAGIRNNPVLPPVRGGGTVLRSHSGCLRVRQVGTAQRESPGSFRLPRRTRDGRSCVVGQALRLFIVPSTDADDRRTMPALPRPTRDRRSQRLRPLKAPFDRSWGPAATRTRRCARGPSSCTPFSTRLARASATSGGSSVRLVWKARQYTLGAADGAA